jgi:hypothetical protein
LDAFAVYEYNYQVVVNLNDALNGSHWSFVEIFTEIIREKWPQVDLLICGLGGASYFPNTVHAANKDDKEIAMLREQFLVHKCCEIMEEIKPLKLMSFVPGFALLEKDKRWINEMRFPRTELEGYFTKHFKPDYSIEFFNPLPGDEIIDNKWYKTSKYYKETENDVIHHLIPIQYKNEIEKTNNFDIQSIDTINEIEKLLNIVFDEGNIGISEDLLKQVNFVIKCMDIVEEVYLHCYFKNSSIKCEVIKAIPKESNILMTTHTWKLIHAATELWGGDVFYIGYGADLHILIEECLKDNIDIVSIRILSRFPSAMKNMIREPFRGIKYLTKNPKFTKIALWQKIYTRGNPNKLPYNERAHWVNKGKCDVCLLCDIPLLSDELGDLLAQKAKT